MAQLPIKIGRFGKALNPDVKTHYLQSTKRYESLDKLQRSLSSVEGSFA